MKHQLFVVTGMSCAACSSRVERVVAGLRGVSQAQVNLLTRSMQVCYNEKLVNEAAIISAVVSAGYKAAAPASTAGNNDLEEKGMRTRVLLSLIFLVPLVALHHIWHSPVSLILQFALLAPILWTNRKFFLSGTRAAMHGAPNMDTLIALGAAAGILYSVADALLLRSGAVYVESAGMILTFITLGKWLESRAICHTGDALNKLKARLPHHARVCRQGKERDIPASEVTAGDILIIAAGEVVPVDAEVLEGCSFIDESTLTGECMPVDKQLGARIYSGTLNGNGLLRAKALSSLADSSLSHIIALVGEASAAKAPIARLADRISGIFVPAVIGLAIMTALTWLLCGGGLTFALGCSISVLVISCPCALGLATPVAIMAGAGKGAENGILFRDAATMENARLASVIVLDKTGTLTAGSPVITAVAPADQVSKETLLQLAGSLEQNSRHPLAQPINKAAGAYTPLPLSEQQYHPGRGISGKVCGQLCLAGNAQWMQENGVDVPECSTGGITPIYIARGGVYMGRIEVADPLKADSAAAVAAMKQRGMRTIIMSGDHAEAVQRVAEATGVDEYHAGALPQDKEQLVARLQQEGCCVAMVGDGINDAPALARADVGIAIGAGTDAAICSAGIILVRNEMSDAVAAFKLSEAVMRTIRQNLFWAFFYNVLGIPLAAGVYYPLLGWQLNPGVAAAAMSLSSLFVVCNALRLRRFRIQQAPQSEMNTTTISVGGMMCPHCERHVCQALCTLPGISEVKADHTTGTVSICSAGKVDEAAVAAVVRQAGYEYKGVC